MKKIYDFKIMALILVIGFAVAPVTAFAADLWSETPDLFNDDEVASVETGPAEFTSSIPRIDMWAETPDHLLRHEDHGVLIDTTPQVVNTFKPEMYAETPDLDSVVAERQEEVFEDIFIVKDE
jgi:hypothetical protein